MKLTGVMSALDTPFDTNGKIDFNAFENIWSVCARPE